MNEQCWRRKVRLHFRLHQVVLCDDCGVDVDATSPAQWETLYRFLTREHLCWLSDDNPGSWSDTVRNAPLPPPLAKPPLLLHSRAAVPSSRRPAPVPGQPLPKAHLLRAPLLTAPGSWHHECNDSSDVRRVTVYMTWRAFCPSFARTSLAKRLFPPDAPAARHGAERCPYCASRLADLKAQPYKTFMTDDFDTLIMQPILDAVREARLEEPPLFGSMAEDSDDQDEERLSACTAGHILYTCQWRMIDAEACDAIDRMDDDDSDDSQFGGARQRRVRCAYADSDDDEDDDDDDYGAGYGGYGRYY